MTVRARKRREIAILATLSSLIFVFILMPIAILFVISFTSGDTMAFPPPGWSLRWYHMTFDMFMGRQQTGMVGNFSGSDRFLESLTTSIRIAFTTMVLTILIAIPAAYALVRYEFRGKGVVEQVISFPTVYPLVVLGISFLILSSLAGFTGGFWRIVFAHIVITFPFVVRNCVASLRGVSRSFEEVAATLGAGPVRAFVEIVLPLIRSGLAAGMLLAFILSFNEFTASFFLYSSSTLPFSMWMYTQASNDLNPVIFALSTVFIVLNILLILLVERISGRDGPSV